MRLPDGFILHLLVLHYVDFEICHGMVGGKAREMKCIEMTFLF